MASQSVSVSIQFDAESGSPPKVIEDFFALEGPLASKQAISRHLQFFAYNLLIWLRRVLGSQYNLMWNPNLHQKLLTNFLPRKHRLPVNKQFHAIYCFFAITRLFALEEFQYHNAI